MSTHKLVPIYPTPEMIHAGQMAVSGFPRDVLDRYQAMLAAAPEVEPAHRSEQQIVDQTEHVAAILAANLFKCEIDEGALYRESAHPKAMACWNAACIVQDILTETDVENAVAMLECEDGHEQPAEQPVERNPDDAAVDRFAATMKAKLNKKRREGRGGGSQ